MGSADAPLEVFAGIKKPPHGGFDLGHYPRWERVSFYERYCISVIISAGMNAVFLYEFWCSSSI